MLNCSEAIRVWKFITYALLSYIKITIGAFFYPERRCDRISYRIWKIIPLIYVIILILLKIWAIFCLIIFPLSNGTVRLALNHSGLWSLIIRFSHYILIIDKAWSITLYLSLPLDIRTVNLRVSILSISYWLSKLWGLNLLWQNRRSNRLLLFAFQSEVSLRMLTIVSLTWFSSLCVLSVKNTSNFFIINLWFAITLASLNGWIKTLFVVVFKLRTISLHSLIIVIIHILYLLSL